jgi:ABC-type multidrug transport system ATPase subunit
VFSFSTASKHLSWKTELKFFSDNLGCISSEPTSGLDSSTAFAVVNCLKALANQNRIGVDTMLSLWQCLRQCYSLLQMYTTANPHRPSHTVICTIHTPSSRIFALIDKLLLLSRGISYFFGRASDAVTHLKGFDMHAVQANPAETCMKLLANMESDEKALRNEEVPVEQLAPSSVSSFNEADGILSGGGRE